MRSGEEPLSGKKNHLAVSSLGWVKRTLRTYRSELYAVSSVALTIAVWVRALIYPFGSWEWMLVLAPIVLVLTAIKRLQQLDEAADAERLRRSMSTSPLGQMHPLRTRARHDDGSLSRLRYAAWPMMGAPIEYAGDRAPIAHVTSFGP